MKYALDRMLPLNAFQGRGTPIGGRSLQLWGYDEVGNWIATGDEVSDPRLGAVVPDGQGGWTAAAPAPAPASEPAPSPEPTPTPAPASAPVAPLTAAAAAPSDGSYDPNWYANAFPDYVAAQAQDQQAAITGTPSPQAVTPNAVAAIYQQMFNAPPPPDFLASVVNNYADSSIDNVARDMATSAATSSAPFANTPGDPSSFTTGAQYYESQGYVPGSTNYEGVPTSFLDPTTGKTVASYGTIAPVGGASTAVQSGNWTWNDASKIPTGFTTNLAKAKTDTHSFQDFLKAGALAAAAVAAPELLGALAPEALGAGALESATAGELGFAGGSGAIGAGDAGAALTAGGDALTAGTLSDTAASSLMNADLLPAEMQIPASGVNWGAAATQAAKTAAINAAVTAAQGGKLGDVLKAGALGAVAGGAGAAGADFLGGGALAQIGTQTAVATALAAATGKDPVQAALTGALTATVANVIPASTSDILNGAGITDPSIQKAVNSAISSSVITAIRGGDIGTAALMGAVNSGLTSVAGMIGDTQVVKDLKASLTDTISSTVDSIKYETGITNAQALPVEGSNRAIAGTPLETAQPDVVNSVFQQDAQNVMNRNVPPPLVQNAIDQNTPKTVADATVSPLIQQATGQTDPNAIYNQLVANAANPTVGAPLATTAGATTSDVNPVAVTTENTGGLLDYLANFPTEIKNQAIGLFEAGMNQLGFVAGNVVAAGTAAANTWYDLATGQPVDPKTIDAVANKVAQQFSYEPVTQEGQNITQTIGAIPEALTGSSMGLPPVTNLAALPAVGTIPTPNLGLLGGDVSNAIANVQRGITMEGPKSFGTTVGETIGGLLPKIDSTGAAISETGALSNATTPMLGYSPTETRANPLTSDRIESLRQALITPDYEINPRYPTTPATQLAPESRGALPTTLAEPSINLINLSPNIDSGTVAKINTEAQAVDKNLSNLSSPQVQAQAKTFVDNAYTALTDKTPSAFTANSLGDIYGLGGTSNDVVAATKFVVENKAASSDTILKQVDKAIAPLNPDEQLSAKLEMLSNASKLGITPAEAIELGLLNNNGTKTELGEKVSPTPQPQPQPKPYPEPVAPLTPVKPALPVKPPLPPIPTPPDVNLPPAGVNPVNPVVNPPIDINPPIVKPPIVNPPPLVQAAIAPPATSPKVAAPATTMTPSYMYGTGTQGTTVGALPGNLQATFLQGVNVNEYNPFENYDKYQQLAPVHAAQGGSPLQLAQMQQGIAGVDPSLYNVLQKRQAPSYFTYGADTSGGNPTTFAGSQLLGKPTPGIPVIPTGQKAGSDWLYQGSGTNPLAMAGTGIPSLPGGMMAEGGQAHGGGEGEHIPEFITGATGHYVRGRGDGQSDDIPAMLADGEYVFDAETVAQLGNGSSDAGAAVLDKMREAIRHHKRSAPIDSIPPKSKSPLEYLAEATKGKGKHHG